MKTLLIPYLQLTRPVIFHIAPSDQDRHNSKSDTIDLLISVYRKKCSLQNGKSIRYNKKYVPIRFVQLMNFSYIRDRVPTQPKMRF